MIITTIQIFLDFFVFDIKNNQELSHKSNIRIIKYLCSYNYIKLII